MRLNTSKYNQHWSDKSLNELGDFQRGKSRHRPRNDISLFLDGKYPLIQTSEIKEANLYITKHSSAYNDFGLAQSKLWPKNTLCITIAANIAETALLGYPMCFPDSVVGFQAFPQESSELFMHYVFTYIRRAIQNSATGSIQDNINIEYLMGLKFKIPLKKYQDKITAILSVLDMKIDCNNRISAELEAIAKALYEYWFVQFDFPDINGKPYKSSGGIMAYNEVLKREIPEEWELRELGALGEFKNGVNYDPNKPGNVACPIINVRNISATSYFLNSSDLDTIFLTKNNAEKYYVDKDDIIIARSGIPGATRLFSEFKPNTIFCGFAIRYKLINLLLKNQVFIFMKSIEASIKNGSAGTILKNVSQDTLKDLSIVTPKSTDVLSEFNNKIDSLFGKLAQIQKENQKLSEIRDWLLPMLMNGQVTVS